MLASSALGLLVARNASRGPAGPVAAWARGRSSVSIAVQEMDNVQDASAAQQVKPFTQVPGPKGMPIIGNSWRFLPIVGESFFNFNINLSLLFGKTLFEFLFYGFFIRQISCLI